MLSLKNEEDDSNDSFSNGGIRKLMIIGLGCNMNETYNNIKIIFDLMNLSSLLGVCNHSIAADLKLLMIILGCQGCASFHPCPYCMASKTMLSMEGAPRTIKNIKELSNKWKKETNKDLKKSKNYCKWIKITTDFPNQSLTFI